jgi:hypothetical protein
MQPRRPAYFPPSVTLPLRQLAVLLPFLAAGCQLPMLDGFVTNQADQSSEALLGAAADGSAAAGRLETLPLEFTFIRHAEDDAELGDELWSVVDEQCLPTDLRYRLASNGLRVGIIRGMLPPQVAARFSPTAELSGVPETSLLEADRSVVRRVVQALPARSNELVATPRVPELVLLERDTRSTVDQLSGQTYTDASAIFDVRISPAADGGVSLSLTPLIKHGPVERNWIGDDGAFRLEAGQRKTVMDQLVVQLPIPADSTLLLSCAGPPASSLGDAFFRDPRGRHEGCRLLAVRLQARTTDPMFVAGPVAEADD